LHLEKQIKPSSAEYEYVHPSPFTMKTVLLKIITAAEIDPFHDLRKFSFLEYASKIVSKEEIQFIEDAFGYYTELVIMNAKDAIQLMKELYLSDFYQKDNQRILQRRGSRLLKLK
jgi:hypothetical protein